MSRKSIKQMFTHPTPGVQRPGGVNISKVREISRTAEKIDKKKNLPENITKTCNPHPTPSDGGGGVRGENVKVTKGLKVSQECSYPEQSRVIRGREGRRQGRIGERGERDERGREGERDWERGSRAKPGIQLVSYNACTIMQILHSLKCKVFVMMARTLI